MRILIIGGTGRLGRVLTRTFATKGYATIPVGSKELDLLEESVEERIEKYHPDYIVHSAALSNVDECERNPTLAYRINAYGTKKIATTASRTNIPLLYISTDYVFDGTTPPYSEDSEPNPVSVYGASKLLGEEYVKSVSSSVILRVSWLFGPEGSNFVDFVIRAKEPVPVVAEQISKPTYTIDLSYGILNLIESKSSGIYHFANSPAVSRLKWTETILKVAKTSKEIKRIDWSNIDAPAKRPFNSALSVSRYENKFGKIRSWEETLSDYING